MTISFRRREHVPEKVPTENRDSLRRACEEFGRRDLYKPLSWLLNLNIRWLDRNLEYFLKRGRYVVAANVMLYESKTDRARKHLEEALRSVKVGSPRHRRLTVVLANLDIVSKIAKRSWELAGKYQARNVAESVSPVSGKRLRIAGAPLFARILVAVDGSKSAAKAAELAVKLAKRNAADLIVVSVVPRPTYRFASVPEVGVPPISLGDYYTYAAKDAEKGVNQAVSLAKGQGVEAQGRVLKASSVVQSITDYANDKEVDLIVLGTRGSGGFKRLLMGSVSNGVVAHAHCPIMVVR
jgi:nucleotide-binding universal stress UspA family protein